MTFYTYMTRNYIGDESPKGDLARDMRADKDSVPKNGPGKYRGWHKILYDYFERKNACPQCLGTFEECWKEYEDCERSRRKRNS